MKFSNNIVYNNYWYLSTDNLRPLLRNFKWLCGSVDRELGHIGCIFLNSNEEIVVVNLVCCV